MKTQYRRPDLPEHPNFAEFADMILDQGPLFNPHVMPFYYRYVRPIFWPSCLLYMIYYMSPGVITVTSPTTSSVISRQQKRTMNSSWRLRDSTRISGQEDFTLLREEVRKNLPENTSAWWEKKTSKNCIRCTWLTLKCLPTLQSSSLHLGSQALVRNGPCRPGPILAWQSPELDNDGIYNLNFFYYVKVNP